MGLINSEGKYLTGEKFQFKVNANGTSLKKKQTWTLEKASESQVAIKSCFGRYLASDKDGKITADSESIGDDNKFELVSQASGSVAIKTVHGRYFSGNGDNMSGFDTNVNNWMIRLAVMPQLNLRNVNRKTYAHLQDDEIHCNEEVPWGHDATISIDYHDGKYTIRASNGQYLTGSGKLQKDIGETCLFVLVIKGDQVAFRDSDGKYLAGVGPQATLQARKTTISKDELFTLEDTNPQFTLIASNKKYVSTLQSTDLRANQFDVKDTEIFQMQAVDRTDFSGNVKWAISSKKRKFWIVNAQGSLECTADDFKSDDAQFSFEWEGTLILLKASNGKYVTVKSGGQLAANGSDKSEETAKFVFEVVNHPIITLRNEHGFVGLRAGLVECARSQYDVFNLTCDAGLYKLSDSSGKSWKVDGNNVSCKTSDGDDFLIEFRAHSRICIVPKSVGQYMKGDHNGAFTCTGGQEVRADTLWEF